MPRGEPRKPVAVPLTEAERRDLEAAASKAGLPLAGYVRGAALAAARGLVEARDPAKTVGRQRQVEPLRTLRGDVGGPRVARSDSRQMFQCPECQGLNLGRCVQHPTKTQRKL